MTFKISDFKDAVASGDKQLARPNLFLVNLQCQADPTADPTADEAAVPEGDTEGVTSALWFKNLSTGLEEKNLHLFVKSCSIPQDTISAIDGAYLGRTVKAVGVRSYDTWQMTLYLEEDHAWRRFFIRWQEKCCGGGNDILSSNNFKGHINIVQLGRGTIGEADKKKAAIVGKVAYKLFDAFPVEIGPVEMSWDNNDSVSEYTVTFAYNWHEVITNDEKLKGLLPSDPKEQTVNN